ncbi:MAG: hypothetical protein EBY21_09865, partial [Alphaproteobacteria bacterium]|nr:hypothetical protein [Alphaproteobacteria bacterium]
MVSQLKRKLCPGIINLAVVDPGNRAIKGLGDKAPQAATIISRILKSCCAVAKTNCVRPCAIKARIVEADERETAKEGGRALLNLGHTFGHAIENAAGYGEYLHGEAVAIGLCAAVRLSEKLGYVSVADVTRVERVVTSVGNQQLVTRQPQVLLQALDQVRAVEHGVPVEVVRVPQERLNRLKDLGRRRYGRLVPVQLERHLVRPAQDRLQRRDRLVRLDLAHHPRRRDAGLGPERARDGEDRRGGWLGGRRLGHCDDSETEDGRAPFATTGLFIA